MPPPSAPADEEELVTAKAGEVVIFNGHLFHGGTTNTSGDLRRCCHLHVIRRDEPQQVDQQRYITRETLARLPEAALAVLDVVEEPALRSDDAQAAAAGAGASRL
jgi:ectoine hydroxylase-related dioxygenase (phytanoyl-CoA dioxygenase family)